MNFELSDEQKMLAEQLRQLLTDRSAPDRLRALVDADADWDEPLWRELAELGFLSVAIAEAQGGLGMSTLDQGIVSEELGRVNAATPFFSSVVLAATALRLAGSEQQQTRWLPQLATGKVVATCAFADTNPPLFDAGRLSGRSTPVADAGVAGMAIVVARTLAGAPALALVDLTAPGVEVTKRVGFDQLRPHYSLTFDGAVAEPLDAAPAEATLDQLLDRAAVQAAFEAVGGAEACLFMARDYALDRPIFGRALASYQAIKHRLADMLVGVELARSAAYYAAWTVDNDPDALPVAASAARLTATEAFERAARENLQIHGGIGYTWEADCHFFYRRERTLALTLGGRERWADRLIAHLPHAQSALGMTAPDLLARQAA